MQNTQTKAVVSNEPVPNKPISDYPMRINKFMSLKGLASRREADILLEAGKVFVNGKKAILGQRVLENDTVDIINVTGGPRSSSMKYVLFHKIPGQEAFDSVKKFDPSLNVLEPLDKDSEGILLCTNDGRLARSFQNIGFPRTVTVTSTSNVRKFTESFIRILKAGAEVRRKKFPPIEAELISESEIRVLLGKTTMHELRMILDHFAFVPFKTVQTKICNFSITSVPKGNFQKLDHKNSLELLALFGLHQ